MKLKQAIVCKHEFTYRLDSGTGTRGSTPGDYITKYMSRPDACEAYGLPRYEEHDTHDSILYRIRLAERSALTQDDLKEKLQQATGRGGFAFGSDGLSLSHEKLNGVSRRFQNLFEKGKTVKKLVISFRTDYLQEMRVIPPDLICRKDGDFIGNVDLGKLRSAVTRGIDLLDPYYDSLYWVATIQEDTQNIHCHACLVDRGTGVLHTDGSQKGMISQRAFQILRRGINMDLQLSRNMAPHYTKESWISNVRSSVQRKFDLVLKANDGIPPALERMVPKTIDADWQPDEYIQEALLTVAQSWLDMQDHRMSEPVAVYFDRMDQAETEDQKNDCYELLMNDCCSVLADQLKLKKNFRSDLPKSAPDKSVFKKEHTQKFHYDALLFHAERRNIYETAAASGTGSQALTAYLKSEAEYHQKMVQIHQQEVSRQGITSLFRTDLDDLMDMKSELQKLRTLQNDSEMVQMLNQMTPQGAEKILMNCYGLPGGAKICAGQIDEYADQKGAHYDRKMQNLKDELSRYGFLVSESGGSFIIESSSPAESVSRYLKAHELYLPDELKQLSESQKQLFRDTAEARLLAYAEIEEELTELPDAEWLTPHDLNTLQQTLNVMQSEEQNQRRFRFDPEPVRISREPDFVPYYEEEFDTAIFSGSVQNPMPEQAAEDDVDFGF